MGGKRRIKPAVGRTAIYACTMDCNPVGELRTPTDKELFNELINRGYLVEVPGGRIQMIGKGRVGVDAEIVPMQEFKILVPSESFMFKNKDP